jgi:hypothetical protein
MVLQAEKETGKVRLEAEFIARTWRFRGKNASFLCVLTRFGGYFPWSQNRDQGHPGRFWGRKCCLCALMSCPKEWQEGRFNKEGACELVAFPPIAKITMDGAPCFIRRGVGKSVGDCYKTKGSLLIELQRQPARYFAYCARTSPCGQRCLLVGCWRGRQRMRTDAKRWSDLGGGAQRPEEAARDSSAASRLQAPRHTADRAWRSPRRRGCDRALPTGSEPGLAALSASTPHCWRLC